MNCPSRNDDTNKHPEWNQSPPSLNADLTTRADLNGISNLREREDGADVKRSDELGNNSTSIGGAEFSEADKKESVAQKREAGKYASTAPTQPKQGDPGKRSFLSVVGLRARRLQEILVKYVQFIGPGFLIAVAYIDPGNYATDVNGKQ